MGCLHNQVGLARYRLVARLGTGVTIGKRKAVDGSARHEKVLQNAVFYYFYTITEEAFVIILVIAVKSYTFVVFQHGVEKYREVFAQNLFVQHFFESLPVSTLFETLALYPMSEDFMEENPSGFFR